MKKLIYIFIWALIASGCSDDVVLIDVYEHPDSKRFFMNQYAQHSSQLVKNKLGKNLILLDIKNSSNEAGKQTRSFWLKVISDKKNQEFRLSDAKLEREYLDLKESNFLATLNHNNKGYLGGLKIAEITDEELHALFINKQSINLELEVTSGVITELFQFEVIHRRVPEIIWPT